MRRYLEYQTSGDQELRNYLEERKDLKPDESVLEHYESIFSPLLRADLQISTKPIIDTLEEEKQRKMRAEQGIPEPKTVTDSFEDIEIKANWRRSIGEFGSQAIHTLRTIKYKELLTLFTEPENKSSAQAIVFYLARLPQVNFDSYATLFNYSPQEVEKLLQSGKVAKQVAPEFLGTETKVARRIRRAYRELFALLEKEPSLVVPFIRDVILYFKDNDGNGFNLDTMAAFAQSEEDIHQIYELRHPKAAANYKTSRLQSEEESVVFPDQDVASIEMATD